MVRLALRTWLLALLVPLATSLPAQADRIDVSAAISLKDALTEIAKLYEARTGDKIEFNFGASGQLAALISEGAPADAFISAGVKEMDQLAQDGLIDPASRRTIARNRLVLIAPADAVDPPHALTDLTDPRFKRIALGQPKTVPAGMYAMEVLKSLRIDDAVKDRLVMGENVRQVLDYVVRGEVDAGIVYATDAAQAGKTVRVVATADGSSHRPIEYPAAVIKGSPSAAAAGRFLDYLGAEAAKQTLAGKGFLVEADAVSPSTKPQTSKSPTTAPAR